MINSTPACWLALTASSSSFTVSRQRRQQSAGPSQITPSRNSSAATISSQPARSFERFVSRHFRNDAVSQDQKVEAAVVKGLKRVARAGDDGFTTQIERSIEQHRHTTRLRESFDQPVVARRNISPHGLQSRAAVDMGDGWQFRFRAVLNVDDIEHETVRVMALRLR